MNKTKTTKTNEATAEHKASCVHSPCPVRGCPNYRPKKKAHKASGLVDVACSGCETKLYGTASNVSLCLRAGFPCPICGGKMASAKLGTIAKDATTKLAAGKKAKAKTTAGRKVSLKAPKATKAKTKAKTKTLPSIISTLGGLV